MSTLEWLQEQASELLSGALRAETAVVFREMAVMLDAGVTISRALDLLIGTVRHPRLFQALAGARERIDRGLPLSRALEPNRERFAPVVVEMVRVGEDSGRLAYVLGRLATYLERQLAMYHKVRSALTYPLVICTICLAVVAFVPSLLFDGTFRMLQDMHAEIPPATRVLMKASVLVRHPLTYVVLAAVAVAALAGYRSWIAERSHRLARDRWLLRLRGIGPVLHFVSLARFSMALETLYSSGVPVLDALALAAGVSGNLVVQEAAHQVAHAVGMGSRLPVAMRAHDVFPDLLVHMVAAGDETGEVTAMLTIFTRLAEAEVEAKLQTMVAALEPALLIVMGAIVGLVATATVGPVLKVMQRLAL